ncbi:MULTISPECIES: hypothetical protein [Cupriavidus]|nr:MULTISPECIES: hypothetical protein [Cupriavidus]MCA7082519.1 hypothetical protein [Cupriavidus sp. DB3]
MHLQGAGDAALERQRKIAPGLQGNQQSEGDRAVEDQAGHVKRRLWLSRCLVIPASLAWNSVVPRLLSQYAVASNGSTWENQRIFMLLATRMPTVTAIQFTQDQMRTLTGVSTETVRHWRKAIPYLASKTGKAARFSFADLLGLSVTQALVSSLGVHIGSVSVGVDALFRVLAASAPLMEGAIVLVTPTTASLHGADSWSGKDVLTEPTLVVALDPLIARLQQQVLPAMSAPAQAALPFPPEAVRSRA